MKFKDRSDAGKKLAADLKSRGYGGENTVIAPIARGGIVLGYELARRLLSPLYLVIVRKIGHPDNPEYALGAVGPSGDAVVSERERHMVSDQWFKREVGKKRREIERQQKTYLAQYPQPELKNKTVIIVDDGIATGLTTQAAINDVSRQDPRQTVLAVPVMPKSSMDEFSKQVNEIVAMQVPKVYAGAVGAYYRVFDQVDDRRLISYLEKLKQAS